MWPFKKKPCEQCHKLGIAYSRVREDILISEGAHKKTELRLLTLQTKYTKLLDNYENKCAKLAETRKRNKILVAAINRRSKSSGK